MTISSRTPEGDANRCPVCGHAVRLEPSRPPGDAPCPVCGSLLWFPAPRAAGSDPKGVPSDRCFLGISAEKPREKGRLQHSGDKTDLNGELIPVGGGAPIPLLRPHLTVGRWASCDIRLHFPSVSGIHGDLSFEDGFWTIRARNSTNGIKVNGQRVAQKHLHPGDTIRIAKREFTIAYTLPAGSPSRG